MDFSVIRTAVHDLKSDFTNGSRVLATKAIQALHDATRSDGHSPAGKKQLREQLRIAGYMLSTSRPSMGTAITSAVVHALNAIQNSDLGAREVLKQEISKRNQTTQLLAKNFVAWLQQHAAKLGSLKIVTLSLSSTLRECLCQAIRELIHLKFQICVLESRPNCEGADFGIELIKGLPSEARDGRFHIDIAPESHICQFVKNVDIVLLGADRISCDGDVNNKMGSFPCALTAKKLEPDCCVVVVSDTHKIAKPGPMDDVDEESGPAQEVMAAWKEETRSAAKEVEKAATFRVHNIYFEHVPQVFVDLYLTERGVMNKDDIWELSNIKEKAEAELFDVDIRSLAERQIAWE
jgi:translation initiation factor 2B subunit (eIF-2B alpha/beta/delta family)